MANREFKRVVKVSETFPVFEGDVWSVMEGYSVAERWEVLQRGKAFFVAKVTEFIPES